MNSLVAYRWLGIGLVVTQLGGCLEEPELADLVDEVPEEELAAESEAATAPTCNFAEYLRRLEPSAWGNVPLFVPSLEFHTCDEKDAGTRNHVRVIFQLNNGVTEPYYLDNPGDDRERNQTDRYYLPGIGSGIYQMEHLKSIRIEKPGTDGWCFDRVALRVGNRVIWEYTAAETHKYTALHPNGGNGKVWLDAEYPQVAEVLFADQKVSYKDRAWHGPVRVELQTCSDNAGYFSPGNARVTLRHDGLVRRTVLPGPPPDTGEGDVPNRNDPGFVESNWISPFEAMEMLESVKLETKGSRPWCIQAVRVYANEKLAYSRQGIRLMVGGNADKWEGQELLLSPTAVETGSKEGILGRVLALSYVAGQERAGYSVMPDAARPECWLPKELSHEALEGMIATMFAAKQWTEDVDWGNGDVRVTRRSNDTVRVEMGFEADAPGRGNAEITLKYNIQVKCQDPDPSNDDDDERAIQLIFSDAEKNVDLPPLSRLLVVLGGFHGIPVMKMIYKAIPSTSRTMGFSASTRCPGISVDAQGDIQFAWPAQKTSNALCKANVGDWGFLASCGRQLFNP